MWANQSSNRWTEEKVATVKALLAKNYSSTRIAAEIGMTRSSIIGKCHRLGIEMNTQSALARASYDVDPKLREEKRQQMRAQLVARGVTVSDTGMSMREMQRLRAEANRERSVALRRTARHAPARPVVLPIALNGRWPAATDESRPAPLWGLAHNGCRWPLYDQPDEENLFCGAFAKTVYCEAHRRASVRQHG